MKVMNKPFNIFEYPYMCFVTFVIHLNRKIENIEILNFDSYADIHWAYVRTYVHAIHTYIPTYIYTYNSGSSRRAFWQPLHIKCMVQRLMVLARLLSAVRNDFCLRH